MSKISIGTDPEGLLFDTSTSKFVPACGLIGGTKRKPLHYSKGLNKGFTIQEDNVLVEWNIPPAFNVDQWADYIQTALTAVANYVASKGPYLVKYAASHKFHNNQMQSEQAQMFGCSPDFNAYENGDEFKRVDPDALKDKGGHLRFAGGHIHCGYQADIPAFVAAAFADYYIGLVGVGFDQQGKRREFYGQPGRYRPTPYGMEYRTPSNYWLRDTDHIYRIGNAALSLCQFLQDTPLNRIRNAYQKIPWGAVRKAITEQDVQLCNSVCQYVNEEALLENVL